MTFKEIEQLYREGRYAAVIEATEPRLPLGNSADDVELLRLLGQSYYAEKRFDDALKVFKRFLKIEANSAADSRMSSFAIDIHRRILARLYAENGQMSEAEVLYQEALSVTPPGSKEYLKLVCRLTELYALCPDYKDSEIRTQQILSRAEQETGMLSPESVTARRNLSKIYLKTNRHKLAESLYANLVAVYDSTEKPTDDLANALCHSARFFVDAARPEQAEAPLLRALRIRQKDSTCVTAAKTLESVQVFYENIKQPEKILSLFPETSDKATEAGEPAIWRKRAVIYARAQNLVAAETELLKLVRHYESTKQSKPSSAGLTNTQYALGQIFILQNKWSEALSLFEAVFAASGLATKSEIVFLKSGEATDLRRSYEDIFGIEKYADRGPRSCHFLAATYAHLGQFSEAEAVYRKSIQEQEKVDPDDFKLEGYYIALAWSQLQQSHFEQALQQVRKAISKCRKDSGSARLLVLEGNENHIIEKQGGDAKSALKLILKRISSDESWLWRDPVEDFGVEIYEGESNYAFGEIKNASGESRIEPYFGYSTPPLVAYPNGTLAAVDNALYPNEFFRGEFYHRNEAIPQPYVRWIFSSFNGNSTGERHLTLANVRLGDLHFAENSFEEAETAYNLALRFGDSRMALPDALATACEHKARLCRKTNRDAEAELLEKRARALTTTDPWSN